MAPPLHERDVAVEFSETERDGRDTKLAEIVPAGSTTAVAGVLYGDDVDTAGITALYLENDQQSFFRLYFAVEDTRDTDVLTYLYIFEGKEEAEEFDARGDPDAEIYGRITSMGVDGIFYHSVDFILDGDDDYDEEDDNNEGHGPLEKYAVDTSDPSKRAKPAGAPGTAGNPIDLTTAGFGGRVRVLF